MRKKILIALALMILGFVLFINQSTLNGEPIKLVLSQLISG